MPYTFFNLTPKEDIDIAVYTEAFNHVFGHEDLKNIAVSGPYGSGKSSVLAAYEKEQEKLSDEKKKKFLHISLARFQDHNSSQKIKNNQKEPLNEEAILEGKILNQLIHQLDPEKIPKTNFRTKKTVSGKRIFWDIVSIIAFLLLFTYFSRFASWAGFVGSVSNTFLHKILNWTLSPYSRVVGGLLLFAVFVYCICRVIMTLAHKSLLKKLTINGTDIEVLGENNDSYFDKYLNEVLYLFEKADVDVIVFEDIDRYEDCKIFERLREINTLVNLHLSRQKKKTIRFFYLLRDDIFRHKDRTKFFDFIIPIVPVVTGANSLDMFEKHLKENGLLQEMDSSFLKKVSLYVDEMRLLLNICNEFVVYYHRIKGSNESTEQKMIHLNPNKMFAMMIYKNVFPKDFNQLQLGQGYVASLFESKKAMIKEQVARIEAEIEAIKKDQEAFEKELIKNRSELDTLFKQKSNYMGSNWVNALSAGDRADYDYRCELIDRREKKKADYAKTLRERNEELLRLPTMSFAELEKMNALDEKFFTQPLEASRNGIVTSRHFSLLKFLIRNGYIDETYFDYTTYFYANSISMKDKDFLLAIANKTATEYTYELNHPELVLENLNEFDFEKKEVLNFHLLAYLLQNKKGSAELKRLILQLKTTRNFAFIQQFFLWSRERNDFVKVLNEQWLHFLSAAIEEGSIDAEFIKAYLMITLYVSPKMQLLLMNASKHLTEYISNDSTFLCTEEPDIDCLIKQLKTLEVRFKCFEPCVASSPLFSHICDHCLYEFTFENICFILKNRYAINSQFDLVHKNYSSICKTGQSALSENVSNHIEEYFELYLEQCGEQIEDEEDCALRVLNNSDISADIKNKYLDYLKTNIQDITAIEDEELWNDAVRRSVVAYSEPNAFELFMRDDTFDDVLVEFINAFPTKFSWQNLCSQLSDLSSAEDFLKGFIRENKIINSQYKAFLFSANKNKVEFALSGIEQSKMNILIDYKWIKMTRENLLFIRKNYSEEVCLRFIRKNIRTYLLQIVSHVSIPVNEVVAILSWRIDDTIKTKVLNQCDDPISYFSLNADTCSEEIKNKVLTNNFNEEDLKGLAFEYGSLPKTTAEIVYLKSTQHLDKILKGKWLISPQLYSLLISDQSISLLKRATLFRNNIKRLEKENIISDLNIMGISDFNDVFDKNKRPRIPIDDVRTMILDALVQRGWITDYNPDGFQKYYTIKRSRFLI